MTTLVPNALLESPVAFISENTTITVASSDGDFTTLKDAYDSLKDRRLAPDVTVTISLAAEVFTETASIVISHPDGSQILISGPTPSSTTITGQQSVSGSAGAYSCILNVTDASIFETGKYCLIGGATGSSGEGHAVYNGCWEVTDVDAANSRITITNTDRNSSFSGGNINNGTAKALNTVVDFSAADVNGFTFGEDGHLRIRNVAIVSTSTSRKCFLLEKPVHYLDAELDVGTHGWGHSFYVLGGTVQGDGPTISNTTSTAVYVSVSGVMTVENMVVTGGGAGGVILNDGSNISAHYCKVAGNVGHGVGPSWGSTFTTNEGVIAYNLGIGIYVQGCSMARVLGSSARVSDNGSHGVYVVRGAMFYIGSSARAENNGSYGVYCAFNSTAQLTLSTTVNDSVATDIKAISYGYIRAEAGCTYTTTSPSVNTEGNEGGYIDG